MKSLESNSLYSAIALVITEARKRAYSSVNTILLETYWKVGQLICEDERHGRKRALYGERLLKKIADQLTIEFGKGFDERNLNNMRAFYQVFPIWNAVRTELSWTYKDHCEQIRQTASAESPDRKLILFLAMIDVNDYIDTSKPAAPLSDMRNSVGLSIKGIKKISVYINKKVLTAVSLFAKIKSTKLNNTCHASMGFGPICAPRRVTYMGAWR